MTAERGTTVAGEQAGTTDEPVDEGARPGPATFRVVPTVSLVAIGFLALCLSPIAFQGGAWFLLFLIPVLVAVWVVRARTRVDEAGLHVRGLVGTRSMAWPGVATLRLPERGWVHAVPHEGSDLPLRGVRIRDLGRVGEASGGRISAPSPAEAEAAAEHARELEATRLRIARLRERQEAEGATGVEEAEGATGVDRSESAAPAETAAPEETAASAEPPAREETADTEKSPETREGPA